MLKKLHQAGKVVADFLEKRKGRKHRPDDFPADLSEEVTEAMASRILQDSRKHRVVEPPLGAGLEI